MVSNKEREMKFCRFCANYVSRLYYGRCHDCFVDDDRHGRFDND